MPRPKSRLSQLREHIAAHTDEGRELIEHAVNVLRGKLETTIVSNSGEFVVSPPTLKDQAEARKFLADRLWGLPMPEEMTLADVSTAELEAEIERRIAELRAGAPGATESKAPDGSSQRRLQ